MLLLDLGRVFLANFWLIPRSELRVISGIPMHGPVQVAVISPQITNLIDFYTIDEASRGPFGTLTLLFRIKSRALMVALLSKF